LLIYFFKVSDAAKIDQQFVWHPFTQMKEWTDPENPPLVIVEAEGSELIDSHGNRYLDGNASIWTNIHGHRDPDLDAALKEQCEKLAHCSALGLANEPAAYLAQDLVQVLSQSQPLHRSASSRSPSPIPSGQGRSEGHESDNRQLKVDSHKVFFSDDGSTAIEAGLKMIHQARVQRGEEERMKLISLGSAYHGDTIGAMSVGHSPVFHRTYKELLFDTEEVMRPVCYRCPYNRAQPEKGAEARKTRKCQWECVGKLREKVDREPEVVSALVLEPRVQGPGGMAMMPDGYLQQASDICREKGVWLMLDEVMTGFGRTGAVFACQKEGVVPDLMALGKGMTGGYLPMAATLVAEEIYNAFLGDFEDQRTFYHGHSYTGNPLGAAVARASLDKLRKTGLERARNLARWLEKEAARFWELENVGEVRQEGTILAIELVEDFATAKPFSPKRRMGHKVCMRAREHGLLTRPIGDVIVLMMPYSTTERQVENAVDALYRAITELIGDGD
jgi:adenosylmethionine-8-amino-7-oxononanoate aminotransferase